MRLVNRGAIGRQIADWQHGLEQKWAALHFGEMKVETDGYQHMFEVQVYLHDLDPDAVRVELYADGEDRTRQEMERVRELAGTPKGYAYRARVPSKRPAADYTARLIPNYSGVAVPLEAARILWQR